MTKALFLAVGLSSSCWAGAAPKAVDPVMASRLAQTILEFHYQQHIEYEKTGLVPAVFAFDPGIPLSDDPNARFGLGGISSSFGGPTAWVYLPREYALAPNVDAEFTDFCGYPVRRYGSLWMRWLDQRSKQSYIDTMKAMRETKLAIGQAEWDYGKSHPAGTANFDEIVLALGSKIPPDPVAGSRKVVEKFTGEGGWAYLKTSPVFNGGVVFVNSKARDQADIPFALYAVLEQGGALYSDMTVYAIRLQALRAALSQGKFIWKQERKPVPQTTAIIGASVPRPQSRPGQGAPIVAVNDGGEGSSRARPVRFGAKVKPLLEEDKKASKAEVRSRMTESGRQQIEEMTDALENCRYMNGDPNKCAVICDGYRKAYIKAMKNYAKAVSAKLKNADEFYELTVRVVHEYEKQATIHGCR